MLNDSNIFLFPLVLFVENLNGTLVPAQLGVGTKKYKK